MICNSEETLDVYEIHFCVSDKLIIVGQHPQE